MTHGVGFDASLGRAGGSPGLIADQIIIAAFLKQRAARSALVIARSGKAGPSCARLARIKRCAAATAPWPGFYERASFEPSFATRFARPPSRADAAARRAGALMQHRTAPRDALDTMLDWAAAEGWNPGLDDAAAFFAAEPDGFFVTLDDAGQPVAAISVVNHTPTFAFLGLYIVRPSDRGRGIGLALWRHALGHAGPRSIGLDGVEAQQDNYAASGFLRTGGTTRFAGTVPGAHAPDARPATESDVPALIAIEGAASGVAKPRYLGAWFAPGPPRVTLVVEAASKIVAMATVRRCREGAKIGPFWAEEAGVAARLFDHCATLFPGPVLIDVPEAATGLGALATARGLLPGFKTARMVRGPAPRPTGDTRFFAVTSLELG